MNFATMRPHDAIDAVAPEGSAVRVLCQAGLGSMAHFTLSPGAVSKAVAHRSVEEIWYFLSGEGRMWRQVGERAASVDVVTGICISIPLGTEFQLRSDGSEPLAVIGATMPFWPGPDEAYEVTGHTVAGHGVTGGRLLCRLPPPGGPHRLTQPVGIRRLPVIGGQHSLAAAHLPEYVRLIHTRRHHPLLA